jgi:hypothetical protein
MLPGATLDTSKRASDGFFANWFSTANAWYWRASAPSARQLGHLDRLAWLQVKLQARFVDGCHYFTSPSREQHLSLHSAGWLSEVARA